MGRAINGGHSISHSGFQSTLRQVDLYLLIHYPIVSLNIRWCARSIEEGHAFDIFCTNLHSIMKTVGRQNGYFSTLDSHLMVRKSTLCVRLTRTLKLFSLSLYTVVQSVVTVSFSSSLDASGATNGDTPPPGPHQHVRQKPRCVKLIRIPNKM